MTEHEHAEVSRKLALAIGWTPDRIYSEGAWRFCKGRVPSDLFPALWRDFDYRDPLVIWRIAERFDCFPETAIGGSGWFSLIPGGNEFLYGDTAALAVARAVIAAKEKA